MSPSGKLPELRVVGRSDAPGAANDRVPDPALEHDIADRTDHYFRRTKAIVSQMGDMPVTYAVFMRRPVIFSPRLAVALLEKAADERGVTFKIELCHTEGNWVGAGDPLFYISGSLKQISAGTHGNVWGVNGNNTVYYRDGNRWQSLGQMKSVSAR